MKTVSIVINKNWETEPVLNALLNSEIRPGKLPFPEIVNTPKDGTNKMSDPRAVLSIKTGGAVSLQAKIWCIQDLMYLNIPPDPATQSSSSSQEKYRVLQPLLSADNPDLVIAVGTAGYPSDSSLNGSIVLGADFFVHDGHPGNPKSNLQHPDVGKVLQSNVNDKVLDLINKDLKNATEPKFLRMPRNPAPNAVCMGSKVFTAVSSINVTDYSEYNWVDREALDHYKATEPRLTVNSLETTHGVIKLSTNKPIIFMSAITDLFGHFDTEVTPTQNYAASFNAGIVMGQLLLALNDFAVAGNEFSK